MDSQFKEVLRERIDFPALVAKTAKMKHSPNGRRATPAFCPFHDNTNTPAMAVYQDHAVCFGACGRSWDLFGWIQQVNNVDFPEALRMAASMAGMSLPEWTPERQQQERQRQARIDILSVATRYYQAQLITTRHAERSPFQYAMSRGWPRRLILRSGLGYAPDDLPGFMRWLDSAGISQDQAIESGLLVKSDHGRVYLRFRERLLFPFIRGGRTHFLTGRDLTGREDLPKWLHLKLHQDDPARPLYGSAAGTGPLAVVESPADKLTLDLIGRDSVAALGTTLPGGAAALLAKHRPLYVMLDPDKAGLAGVYRLGDALGPRCLIVKLPGGDSNAILQQHGRENAAKTISSAMNSSITYIEYLAKLYRSANPDEQPDLLDRFLASIIKMDDRDMALMRNTLADLSGLGIRQLRELVKSHVQIRDESDGYAPSLEGFYQIISGCICQMSTNGPKPLTDFSAVIERELRLDDGNEITNEYQIVGATESGRPLPAARVPAADFADMGWIDQHWGVSAVVAAGQKNAIAAAIKLLSKGAESMTVYTHTGWRMVDGQRVFLHCDGAVGYKGHNPIQVELGKELENYRLPSAPMDPVEDFRTSLNFFQVGDPKITLPIWAAMYQAPLGELLSPRMVVWCYGPTNTFKSTLVLLAMRHYGLFQVEGDALSWNWTDNAIELAGYMLKDLPLLVDDFAHQPNHYQQKKLQQAAERIIRSTGNEAGRGRMDSKRQKHRTTTTIRSLIISTGETMPSVAPSAHSRILPIRFQPGSVNLDRLSAAQAEAQRYSYAMTGYLLWLRDTWETHARTITPFFHEIRTKARENCTNQTARLSDAISRNYVAFNLAMDYGQSVGAIDQKTADDYLADHWRILLELAELQDREVKQEDPVLRFLSVLQELIQAQRVWLAPLNVEPAYQEELYRSAQLIGYQDTKYYWLLFDVCYEHIQKHATSTGHPLTFAQREMKERLFEADVLIKERDDRWTVRLQNRFITERPRCVKLDREKINYVLGE